MDPLQLNAVERESLHKFGDGKRLFKDAVVCKYKYIANLLQECHNSKFDIFDLLV